MKLTDFVSSCRFDIASDSDSPLLVRDAVSHLAYLIKTAHIELTPGFFKLSDIYRRAARDLLQLHNHNDPSYSDIVNISQYV